MSGRIQQQRGEVDPATSLGCDYVRNRCKTLSTWQKASKPQAPSFYSLITRRLQIKVIKVDQTEHIGLDLRP